MHRKEIDEYKTIVAEPIRGNTKDECGTNNKEGVTTKELCSKEMRR